MTWDSPLEDDRATFAAIVEGFQTDRTHERPPIRPVSEVAFRALVGDSGYDPNVFYKGNARQKESGNRNTVQTTSTGMSPALYDLAMTVAHDRILPYGSMQALIRDALVHRLHDIMEMAEDEERNMSPTTKAQLDGFYSMLPHIEKRERKAGHQAMYIEAREAYIAALETDRATGNWQGIWDTCEDMIEWSDNLDVESYQAEIGRIVHRWRTEIIPNHWSRPYHY